MVTDGVARKRSTSDIIGRLLQTELTERQWRSVQYRITQAKFPQHKSLATFKFEQSPAHQPSIDLLMEGDYIKQKRNIILVDEPGTATQQI